MFIEEADAKALFAAAGIPTPIGALADSAVVARQVGESLGPVMVKAQVPSGKRGKAGGIVAASTPTQAAEAATRLLGAEFAGVVVERVLVEAQVDIARELYVAVTVDPQRRCPVIIVSASGGVDIEEVNAESPQAVHRVEIPIADGLEAAAALDIAALLGLAESHTPTLAGLLVTLYGLFRSLDAQLVEINPLAIDASGALIALDAKLIIDDNALFRQGGLPAQRPSGTALEQRAAEQDFLLVELDGDVGVLANGAGLTMSTMDAVSAQGGRPANFLEVGGMAYKRATPALALVLSNPNVRSLLVNLCGAYARTDVIAEGLIAGWKELAPEVPVSFCIHGTGEERARMLVETELGISPHDTMVAAVNEAVANAADATAAAAAAANDASAEATT